MTKQKYYAVKAGRKTGIYRTWAECQKQVIGYPGALFKSFLSELEAQEYIEGAAAARPAPAASNTNPVPAGNHYDIYVDGSYDNSKKKYSWGFAVYRGSEVVHTASGIGENAEAAATRNVAGELEATMNAVLWAEAQQDIDSITIHHDYIGISEWATGKWKTNNTTTQGYACFIRPYLTWVSFNKVAGHTGIAGNELADKLAGDVLKQA